MARKKRPPNPLLNVAREYLAQKMPELSGAALTIRQLDGPAEGPRFAVTAERCNAMECPFGIPRHVADMGACPRAQCHLRSTVRLLMRRSGEVVNTTRSGIHWGNSPNRDSDS